MLWNYWGGPGSPLQYSGLEDPIDWGAWSHRVRYDWNDWACGITNFLGCDNGIVVIEENALVLRRCTLEYLKVASGGLWNLLAKHAYACNLKKIMFMYLCLSIYSKMI